VRREVIFQQDNDPKPPQEAKKWMKTHNITLLDWPAQSPDITPIEHQWVSYKEGGWTSIRAPKGVGEIWEKSSRSVG